MKHLRRYGSCLVVLVLFLGGVPVVHAESISAVEKEKIEALIKIVAGMNDATFVRNGTDYNAQAAERFLRLKWAANSSQVKTAEDFVQNIGSRSGTSGAAYLIRFKDGREVQSREFLMTALNKLENTN